MRRLFGADSLRSDNRCSLGTAAHCAATMCHGRPWTGAYAPGPAPAEAATPVRWQVDSVDL